MDEWQKINRKSLVFTKPKYRLTEFSDLGLGRYFLVQNMCFVFILYNKVHIVLQHFQIPGLINKHSTVSLMKILLVFW